MCRTVTEQRRGRWRLTIIGDFKLFWVNVPQWKLADDGDGSWLDIFRAPSQTHSITFFSLFFFSIKEGTPWRWLGKCSVFICVGDQNITLFYVWWNRWWLGTKSDGWTTLWLMFWCRDFHKSVENQPTNHGRTICLQHEKGLKPAAEPWVGYPWCLLGPGTFWGAPKL